MAGLIDVFNRNDISAEKFLNDIDGKELIIYEDVQASKVYVRYDSEFNKFIIKPKSLKNDEINLVDLSIQKYYNKLYIYLHSLPKYITDMINTNWWFVLEYFADERPAHIEYKKLPENNLILTSIVKNNKHKFNYEEILEYSKLFGVSPIGVIFKGKLSPKQMEIINLYLNTKEEDLKFIFGEECFSKFFYTILNPNLENSFLMLDGEFNDNVEKIIIKVDGDDRLNLALLNPLYQRKSENNKTEYTHVYSLILTSFLEFLQLKDLQTVKVKGLTKDEIYINLISLLFNEYIANLKDDIDGWEIFIPNFIKEDKFKINIDLIRNKDTQRLIKSSDKIEYIFKVILGSFNKYRKKPIGVMKESTVDFFNKKVLDINNYIESLLSINRDYIFQKVDLLNFNDYFNIKFDRDASGEIYPDVDNDFDLGEISQHKKGKKDLKK